MLLLNIQSQIWFQVISYYRVHAVLVTDARWNRRCMLSFKGCPKANTSLIPCSLISGWLRTALKSVIVFPCFLISQMKNFSTHILNLCVELTSETYLCSFQLCYQTRAPAKWLLLSIHLSTEGQYATLQERGSSGLFAVKVPSGLRYACCILLLKNLSSEKP